MLYTVFCFKDKRLKKFTSPALTQLKDSNDLIEEVSVEIVKSTNRAVFKGKNLVVLGTWDSDTGLYATHDPEFLLNCDEIISECEDYERKAKKTDN